LRDDGGGLYISGTLSLAGSQIISNTTEPSGGHGGGLYLLSPATIRKTVFKHNLSNGSGAGLFTSDWLDISGSHFENNHTELFSGGAIRSSVALTVSNSSFVSNSSGGRSGAINFLQVDALIQDSHFENNWCKSVNCDGGAIANTSSSLGSLIISNSNFISNSANRSGGAIYNATHVSISEGLISENVAQGITTGDPGDGGGGLYAGSLMVTGTRFISNTAGDDGGAALVLDSAVITNVLVEGNKTLKDDGGGLYISGTLSLADSQIISNTTEPSGGHGGGLYLLSPATIRKTVFKHNISDGSGAGLFTSDWLDISGSHFENNHTELFSGGAIRSSVALTVSNGSFVSNSSGGRSGAINLFQVDALIRDSYFENNWCKNVNCDGGAMANTSTSLGNLELRETRFVGNRALGNGGGVFITGAGPNIIVNSLFDRNMAGENGSGLYLGNDTTIVHTTIASPTLSSGQAIYINAGAVDIINSIIASHTVGIENAVGLVTSNYNVYFGNGIDVVGTVTQSNIETLNPLFADPAAGDYRLMTGSSALDKGVDAGIYIDIAGATRPVGADFDRGAYEGTVIFRLMLPILLADI
jgi:predicted outer membrane repeat protein